ncbi:MAG TPA: LPS assembly lipoprotein LptE [Cellvibrionaceae bacterium]
MIMRALVLIAIFATSACGWHLRGQLLPPPTIDSLHITSTAQHTDLLQQLAMQLDNQGVAVVDDNALSNYTLALGEETLRRRTVGVGSDALAAAYELTLTVEYQLLNATDLLGLGEPLSASVSRSYNYTDNDPGAAAQEERLLSHEMRQELVQQLLRRIFVLIDQHQQNHDQAAP